MSYWNVFLFIKSHWIYIIKSLKQTCKYCKHVHWRDNFTAISPLLLLPLFPPIVPCKALKTTAAAQLVELVRPRTAILIGRSIAPRAAVINTSEGIVDKSICCLGVNLYEYSLIHIIEKPNNPPDSFIIPNTIYLIDDMEENIMYTLWINLEERLSHCGLPKLLGLIMVMVNWMKAQIISVH